MGNRVNIQVKNIAKLKGNCKLRKCCHKYDKELMSLISRGVFNNEKKNSNASIEKWVRRET